LQDVEANAAPWDRYSFEATDVGTLYPSWRSIDEITEEGTEMLKRTAQLFQEAKNAKITRDLQMFGFLKNISPDLDEEWMNPPPAPADVEWRPLLDNSSTTVSDELAASETATAAAADAEHRAEQRADAATAGATAAAEAAIQKLQRDFEVASAAGAAALPKAIDAQNAMKVVPLPPSRSLSSPPSSCSLSISLSVPQPNSGEQTRRWGGRRPAGGRSQELGQE
jgi:hypothetical protein